MSAPAWPLVGHDAAEEAFLSAAASGRLHHAWLLEGPAGIGKAQMARRLAAWLLGARGQDERPLDSPVDDPVAEKLLAGAHPDHRWLKRQPNERGQLPQFIPVDRVRADLVHFFTLRPALGGRRVCVLDSLDELNASGANALLKTLEEPPADSILILISHGARPILPTIRSRCRRLRLEPLGDDEVAEVLAMKDETADAEAIRLAGGRPGRALAWSQPAALEAAKAAQRVVERPSRPDARTLSDAIAAASGGEAAFEAFAAVLLDWAAKRAEREPAAAGLWLSISRLLAEARADQMDAAQTAAKLLEGLQQGEPIG